LFLAKHNTGASCALISSMSLKESLPKQMNLVLFCSRIMAVDSADEFYSIMGVLTREMLEFGLMDTNNLIKVLQYLSYFS